MKRDLIFTVGIIIASTIGIILIVAPIAALLSTVPLGELLAACIDTQVMHSLLLTFECALYATLIAIILGIPLAYILSFSHFPLKRFVCALLDIPMIIPHTASGIALLFVFGSGKVGDLLQSIGIPFVGSKFGIVSAMTFVAIPYFVNSVHNGFTSIDKRMISVARTLGASHRQVFFKVIVPLSARSIFSGALMMWGRGISEFGAIIVIAYHPMVAPVLLYDRFTMGGLKSSLPVAGLLIVLCIACFIIVRSIMSKDNNAHSS